MTNKVVVATVLAFAGRIGSGKSTISKRLSDELQWPRVSFGQYVRALAERRGLGVSRKTLQDVGASLIQNDLSGFCNSVLHQVNWTPGKPLIIDGVRHAEMVEELKRQVSPSRFALVFIDLDEITQRERLSAEEERSIDTIEAHSTEQQVTDCLPHLADLMVRGDIPEATAIDEIIAWLCSSNAAGGRQ